ncbi:MAG: hypothetical protein ACLSB9_17915 [Hydrogeniiclostridium mannosilyticum]
MRPISTETPAPCCESHIARNENCSSSDAERKAADAVSFPHLTDLVWWTPPCWRRAAGRRGRDGDMVKTIADHFERVRPPNYEASRGIADDALQRGQHPLLMIPSATLIRSAEVGSPVWWCAVPSPPGGEICNAALDRSIIAYNENSDAEERKRLGRDECWPF